MALFRAGGWTEGTDHGVIPDRLDLCSPGALRNVIQVIREYAVEGGRVSDKLPKNGVGGDAIRARDGIEEAAKHPLPS